MAINLDRTLSRNGRKRWQIVEHPLFGENLMESSQRYSGFRLLRPPARRKTTADSDNEKLSGRLLRQHRAVQSHYVIRLFYVRLFYVGNGSAQTRGQESETHYTRTLPPTSATRLLRCREFIYQIAE